MFVPSEDESIAKNTLEWYKILESLRNGRESDGNNRKITNRINRKKHS